MTTPFANEDSEMLLKTPEKANWRWFIRLRGCSSTWARSPPVSPRCPLWGLVSRTAALPAGEGETTRGEPPSARHRDSGSLQQKAGGNNDNMAKWMKDSHIFHSCFAVHNICLFNYQYLHHQLTSCYTLTCQLHIVAQLSGDWQLGVELGCPL